ncbi:MAG: hemoglobin [Lentisphaeria bacterium]|jgi:hemoglobin
MKKIGEVLPFGFEDTSFQAAGGLPGIIRLVDAFYEIMDTLPEVHALREIHPSDLKESKEKLARFLSGWFGGPKKYSEKYGTINIPQAHQHLPIGEAERDMWLLCMGKAIARQPYSDKYSNYLIEQLKVPANRILDRVLSHNTST